MEVVEEVVDAVEAQEAEKDLKLTVEETDIKQKSELPESEMDFDLIAKVNEEN